MSVNAIRQAIWLLLISGIAHAGQVNLSWTAPIKNTDGTTLTDLAGYLVSYGQQPDTLTEVVSLSNVTSYTVTDLTAGKWYFAVAAVNESGVSSAPSNIVSKDIVESTPVPPTLKVQETTVYQIIGTLDKFTLLPVGSVPGDTSCDPSQSVNGHYVVPRAQVTWFGSVRPQAVVALCSGD